MLAKLENSDCYLGVLTRYPLYLLLENSQKDAASIGNAEKLRDDFVDVDFKFQQSIFRKTFIFGSPRPFVV